MSSSAPFTITRTVAAPRELVWKAYTERDRLMQWFGPVGLSLPKATLELRPGGVFHYCMRTPDGHEMWGKWIFREITPPERLVNTVSFSDESQGVTRHPMAPTWPLEMLSTLVLKPNADGTTTGLTLQCEALNATPEEQQTFDAGHDSMRAGFGGTLDNLDRYLAEAQRGGVA